MPDPSDARPGRPHLARDSQQWIFDYVVQQSGLTYHWWSEERSLPVEVRSHAMISKHLGTRALAREAEAATQAAAGDRPGALAAYFRACRDFLKAQHPVFELNPEKLFLYEGLQRCYEQVRALAPYEIERVDVAWEGHLVGGWLHRNPGGGRAPLLFYVPGCDTTCEATPDPSDVREHAQGWHVFSFDGPGIGRSNIRGIRLAAGGFERAASAVLDELVRRPDVDGDAVVAYGGGAGSHWALRFAAHDPRLRAVASKSTYASLYYLMNEDSPRYKQLFAFLTQARSEAELDAALAGMTLDGLLGRIACPVLMLTGEYDLRDPIEEVYRLFDQVLAPAELWVFADQFHRLAFADGGTSVYQAMLDWLGRRLDGIPPLPGNPVRYIEPAALGPTGVGVRLRRHWYEPGTPADRLD